MVQKKVHELVEPLSSEQIWQPPFPYGNSIGNLIPHLTGNLNYYIGARVCGCNVLLSHNGPVAEECRSNERGKEVTRMEWILLLTPRNQGQEEQRNDTATF